MNSILSNNRLPYASKPKANTQYNNEKNVMNKFLNGSQKKINKFSPSQLEYKSLKNGQKYEVPLERNKEVSAPDLKPKLLLR